MMMVRVLVVTSFDKPVVSYRFDWDNIAQRRIFAERADDALRAGQHITTYKEIPNDR